MLLIGVINNELHVNTLTRTSELTLWRSCKLLIFLFVTHRMIGIVTLLRGCLITVVTIF